MAALARAARYSQWHAARLFKEVTGKSPFEYVRLRRRSAAAEELRRSSRKVVDLAFDSVLDSHEGFTRAFARQFGVSPLRFRTTGSTPNALHEQAISSLWDAMKAYKPELYGFAWADADEERFYRDCRGFMGFTLELMAEVGPDRAPTMDDGAKLQARRPLSLTPEVAGFCSEYMTQEVRSYTASARLPDGKPAQPLQARLVPNAPVGLPSWSAGKTVEVAFQVLPVTPPAAACSFDGEIEGLRCAFASSGAPNPQVGTSPADASTLLPVAVRAPAQGMDRYLLVAGLWSQPAMARMLDTSSIALLNVRCQLRIVGAAKGARIQDHAGRWLEGYHPFVGRVSECRATQAKLGEPAPPSG